MNQILDNWRSKRILDPSTVDAVLMKLDAQKAAMHSAGTSANGEHASSSGRSQHHDPNAPALARTELVRRIEEDRERHKRLRERRWVQPIHPASTLGSTVLVTQLASLAPDPDTSASAGTALPAPGPGVGGAAAPRALDIEFDNEWETTSDWNEDDDDAIVEENALCYPSADIRLSLNTSVDEREGNHDMYARADS